MTAIDTQEVAARILKWSASLKAKRQHVGSFTFTLEHDDAIALAIAVKTPPACDHTYRPLFGGCRCEKCGHQIAWDMRLAPTWSEAQVGAARAAFESNLGLLAEYGDSDKVRDMIVCAILDAAMGAK